MVGGYHNIYYVWTTQRSYHSWAVSSCEEFTDSTKSIIVTIYFVSEPHLRITEVLKKFPFDFYNCFLQRGQNICKLFSSDFFMCEDTFACIQPDKIIRLEIKNQFRYRVAS